MESLSGHLFIVQRRLIAVRMCQRKDFIVNIYTLCLFFYCDLIFAYILFSDDSL